MTRRVGHYGKRYNRAGSRSGGPPTLPDAAPKCSKAQLDAGCWDADKGCWCPPPGKAGGSSRRRRGGRRFSGPAHPSYRYFRDAFYRGYEKRGFLGAVRHACKVTYLHFAASMPPRAARKICRGACMAFLHQGLRYPKRKAVSICNHVMPGRRFAAAGERCEPHEECRRDAACA